jgi:hypothetical protein
MASALQELRAQRHAVVRSWDGEEAPPRIASRNQRRSRPNESPEDATVLRSGRVSAWRAIRLRLKRA